MIDIFSNKWNALVLIGTAQRMLMKISVPEEAEPKLRTINAHLSDAYLLLSDITEGAKDDTTSESGKSDS